MAEILPMTEADLEAKARLHVRCWHETYEGLVPQAWLDENITYGRMLARQRRIGWERVLLAWDRGVPVGFASWEDEARAWAGRRGVSEVSSIYLLRSHQERGMGRALMEAALMEAALERCAHESVALLVLAGNDRAIGFHEHLGFSLTGRSVADEPLTELEMLR